MAPVQHNSKIHSRRDFMKNSSKAIGGLALAGAMAGALPRSAMAVNTAPKKLRIGIVGGGFGASFYWHDHPDCIVEAVSDLREDRRKKLTETYKCSKVYNSLEELVLDKNIDAVAIFTEPPNHVKHSVLAMKQGKHVISAVPAFWSFHWKEEAELLLNTVKETGLTYMMAETTYYHQGVISARKWFKEGKFGELYHTEAEYHHPTEWKTKTREMYGLRDWAFGIPPFWYPTHTMSFLISITGERLTTVTGVGKGDDSSPCCKDNVYKNPFYMENAFFITDKKHSFKASRGYGGAIQGSDRGRWFGDQMTFFHFMPYGMPGDHNYIYRSEEGRKGKDDAGFEMALPAVEDYQQEPWWQTDMLPEPMRHNKGGHDGSHPFLTHEFIDALIHDRRPSVDIYEAIAYTVPGFIAHESALKGGEQMKIPSYDK